MLYCRVWCFCIALCLLSLIWLDVKKMCFHQPCAVQGPITLSSSEVRVSLARSTVEQVAFHLHKAISLASNRQNALFQGINRGHQLLCRHALCSSQYGRVCQAALELKAGTLSSFQTNSNSAIAFPLKAFRGTKLSPPFRLVSGWPTEIKPKNPWKSRLSPILLSFSFLSSYLSISLPKDPRVLQAAFRTFYIYSHIIIMSFFVTYIFQCISVQA